MKSIEIYKGSTIYDFMPYDKNKLNKAGVILRKGDQNSQEFKDAIKVYGEYRQNFGYPLNTFQATLRNRLKKLGIDSFIVSQRLKRVESVINKLKRKPMKLYKMQDIGGLRVVVPTLQEVENIVEAYKNTELSHSLWDIDDYIRGPPGPKNDGYRSIHLKYEVDYANKKKDLYKGLRIELQIRTEVQHSWATAVEIFSTHFDKGLKHGSGEKKHISYFKLASDCFQILERKSKLSVDDIELFKKLKILEDKLHMKRKLSLGNALISTFSKSKGTIIVMYLSFDDEKNSNGLARLYRYQNTKKGYNSANQHYTSLEQAILGRGIDGNVVLISGVELKKIKLAYPNYFLDANKFIKNLDRIIKLSRYTLQLKIQPKN